MTRVPGSIDMDRPLCGPRDPGVTAQVSSGAHPNSAQKRRP